MGIEFNEYQRQARATAIYPRITSGPGIEPMSEEQTTWADLVEQGVDPTADQFWPDKWGSEVTDKKLVRQSGDGLTYPALGLAGEAGEVVELVKKMHRDDLGVLRPERREKLKKELGDVLWYVSELARQAGLSLQEVAEANLTKLSARQAAGKLQGDGSDR